MNDGQSSATISATAGNAAAPQSRQSYRAGSRMGISLLAHGEPVVWLTGGALAISILMIVGLLSLVFFQGIVTFWPMPVERIATIDGKAFLGEVTRNEQYLAPENLASNLSGEQADRVKSLLEKDQGRLSRRLLRSGNFDLTGLHFHWIDDFAIKETTFPQWAVVIERQSWGRFYGTPTAFKLDGNALTTDPAEVWRLFQEHQKAVRDRWSQRVALESRDVHAVNSRLRKAKTQLNASKKKYASNSQEVAEAEEKFEDRNRFAKEAFARIQKEIAAIDAENQRHQLVMTTVDGQTKELFLTDCVRAYPANQLTFPQKLDIFGSRWIEFLSGEPREANSEGGVFPAIFGTVVMTLVMSIAVVPFGVLAALYLREYAKPGPLLSAIRIAINNLAGVPSIVFGVFGLGFFCYIVGGSIDQILFSDDLPSPTYGKGGLIWAALTLALLTLPVVIVATEESLAAVPSSMREGSYACGASKWQTIRNIVLPRALPGIMTGFILAMARGAGEVAPLMLVGAVKLAPELPIDGHAPFIHMERSFMHLGFHIYDLGFQSQNSEAAKPMVYTTTLLLISIIFILNIAAILLRTRLRRRFQTGQF